MSLTVLESIADTLFNRLVGMIDDDTLNTLVFEVIRPSRYGDYTPQDRQIVFVQGSSVAIPELSCPGNPPAVAKAQTFNVHVHLMTDENSEDAVDYLVNAFVGDVISTITAPSTWYNLDGYAIDTEILEPEIIRADGAICGAMIPVVVTYRHSDNDPYTVR